MTTAELVIATLAMHPDGLTTTEVAAIAGLPSYTAAAMLSRLKSYGTISGTEIAGNRKMRWQAKPQEAA